jgi:uncharacterized protein YkwD
MTTTGIRRQYVHGQVEPTGRAGRAPSGRHRGRRPLPAPVALGLTVFALLTAFGAGAALLPSSLTGPGTAAERPAAAVAALAPGAGGGVPGATASASAPASPQPSSAATTAKASPRPSKAPTSTAAKPKPKVTRTATRKASPVAAGLTGQENEVIRLTNVERDQAGCGAVRLNTRLRTAMRLHVQELGRRGDLYISHVSADGRSFVDRARQQGYTAAGGENVARGQRDAADVMTSWMNSEGHRANILNCDFEAIGVGAVKGVDGTIVWGQIFGRE